MRVVFVHQRFGVVELSQSPRNRRVDPALLARVERSVRGSETEVPLHLLAELRPLEPQDRRVRRRVGVALPRDLRDRGVDLGRGNDRRGLDHKRERVGDGVGPVRGDHLQRQGADVRGGWSTAEGASRAGEGQPARQHRVTRLQSGVGEVVPVGVGERPRVEDERERRVRRRDLVGDRVGDDGRRIGVDDRSRPPVISPAEVAVTEVSRSEVRTHQVSPFAIKGSA